MSNLSLLRSLEPFEKLKVLGGGLVSVGCSNPVYDDQFFIRLNKYSSEGFVRHGNDSVRFHKQFE